MATKQIQKSGPAKDLGNNCMKVRLLLVGDFLCNRLLTHELKSFPGVGYI